MRILHCLGSAIDEASGPTQSVLELARAQGAAGAEALLFSQLGQPLPASPGFAHRTFPTTGWGKRLLHSQAMAAAVRTLSVDVVHNHAMWMAQGIYARRARAERRARLLVTSPRGSLSQWAMNHHRWRKRLFWPLFQHAVLAQSDLLHATAEHELDDIRRHGLRQPVALIPNGVDLPDLAALPGNATGNPRSLLFLARIHPVKGLGNLLDAWVELEPRHRDWRLAIAGPEEGGAGFSLAAEIAQRGLKRVDVLGPLYGDAKTAAYAGAELYVLPSFSENFGLTVAEALSCGTPVITTRATPWRTLEVERAGWWIDVGVRPLVECLDAALALAPADLAARGARGRDWVERHLGWQSLAEKMLAAYRFALDGGSAPDFIDRVSAT